MMLSRPPPPPSHQQQPQLQQMQQRNRSNNNNNNQNTTMPRNNNDGGNNNGGSNSTSNLATLSPEQQKNVLGERLYEHISRAYPQHASKVTGMLLEMDNAEILNLLDSTPQLDAKVKEALEVLQRHNQA